MASSCWNYSGMPVFRLETCLSWDYAYEVDLGCSVLNWIIPSSWYSIINSWIISTKFQIRNPEWSSISLQTAFGKGSNFSTIWVFWRCLKEQGFKGVQVPRHMVCNVHTDRGALYNQVFGIEILSGITFRSSTQPSLVGVTKFPVLLVRKLKQTGSSSVNPLKV